MKVKYKYIIKKFEKCIVPRDLLTSQCYYYDDFILSWVSSMPCSKRMAWEKY